MKEEMHLTLLLDLIDAPNAYRQEPLNGKKTYLFITKILQCTFDLYPQWKIWVNIYLRTKQNLCGDFFLVLIV